jgi:hypothetical protein
MLPFASRPWAKYLSGTVIVVTLIAAVIAPLYLRHIRHLDPPMAVLIVLLVLAIVPPNYVVWLRHQRGHYTEPPAAQPPQRIHRHHAA